MLAYLFPGQGSQHPGMGRVACQLSADARAVFDAARDSGHGRDYTEICFGKNSALLRDTEYAQPAIFLCSLAALAVISAEGLLPGVVAGHSVGEMAALVSAGSMAFGDALAAVELRGSLMQLASSGAMLSVVGLDLQYAVELCHGACGDDIAVVGLVNARNSWVVSGSTAAVERVRRAAIKAGALHTAAVTTNRAFHSPLMADVSGEWREYVAELPIARPNVPILLSTTGKATFDPDEIRRAMVDQFTHPVRWDRVTDALLSLGATVAVEIGESKTLQSLVRMVGAPLRAFTTLGRPDARRLAASINDALETAAAQPVVAEAKPVPGASHAVR